jgi:hypothetical protein
MYGRRGGSGGGRPAGGRAGVALLELAPVGLTGAPTRQLEVLRGLAEVGTDPLASLLALRALAAEGS